MICGNKRTDFPIHFCIGVIFLIYVNSASGQDVSYAKTVIRKLCSKTMHGRGYSHHGDLRAARYIRKEYERIGLTPLSDSYFYPFTVDANTFPGKMKLTINGIRLEAGRDYILHPASGSCRGKFLAVDLPLKALTNNHYQVNTSVKGNVVIVDTRNQPDLTEDEKKRINSNLQQFFMENPLDAVAIIEVTDQKLSYGISSMAHSIPFFRVKAGAFPDRVSEIEIAVRNDLQENYITNNLAGFIKGKTTPDSLVVFTAHYDHLGTMGRDVYFPGANDNASGVAMMLSIADYFRKNPPACSVAFLALSAEELGLLGSQHFADNPPVGLACIGFLINLDLVGNGDEGITVVNGSVYPSYLNNLLDINESEKFLPLIKTRGEACNSDHCPFYRKGVPSFFIYTLGGSPAYHDTDDRPENLSLQGFEGLVQLLIEFTEGF